MPNQSEYSNTDISGGVCGLHYRREKQKAEELGSNSIWVKRMRHWTTPNGEEAMDARDGERDEEGSGISAHV
jgi:hypothetical protein